MPYSYHPSVLVVEAAARPGTSIADLFRDDDFDVVQAGDFGRALEDLRSRQYAAAIIDLDHPLIDGPALVRAVKDEGIPTAVLVLSGEADRRLAIELMRAGAVDFVVKPIQPERLRCQVQREVESRRISFELAFLRSKMDREHRFHEMVSRSPKMLQVFRTIKQVSTLGSGVLIKGETGTGKELVARAIHAGDTRRRGAFVAINCAVLRENLLENELFGHEAGAYTGADRRVKGRFELADGGTLFLDEIGEIPPTLQAKLLRVLQSGTFERLGGSEPIKADVRVVAASNKDLAEEAREGRFRADLLFRLRVVQIELPPLRDRKEDIPLLATHFLQRCEGMRTPAVTSIHPEAMAALINHDWPGNVRELENAVKSGVAMAHGTILHRDDLPESIVPPSQVWEGSEDLVDIDRPLLELTGDLVARVEREYLSQLLARYRGNVAKTARHSGLSRRGVSQKIEKLELDRGKFRVRRNVNRAVDGFTATEPS